ncbi:MAG: hypothetical protein KIT72_14240 [Polyangiaceae bacterium]|nr:hypothetical protein [Polyangiaceae bacterium]MCW5791573.1 hypothetical protein [Polyangiaceae bacterium]
MREPVTPPRCSSSRGSGSRHASHVSDSAAPRARRSVPRSAAPSSAEPLGGVARSSASGGKAARGLRRFWTGVLTLAALGLAAPLVLGCEDRAEVSVARAEPHAERLVQIIAEDVAQVERGLPAGATALGKRLFPARAKDADAGAAGEADAGAADGERPVKDAMALQTALEDVRRENDDLRPAKSTFFAITSPAGIVWRNDQDQDRMAGQPLFDFYPGLKPAATGSAPLVRARGSMEAASGIRGREDAQWVVASPIREAGAASGPVRAVYASGWSWTSYAYRLENALQTWIREEMKDVDKPTKAPLTYVLLVVGEQVYGAPVVPVANLELVRGLPVLSELKASGKFKRQLSLSNRAFGLVALPAPALGDDVAVALLRSEP